MRSLPDGLHARRVGFRSGTDAELTALHTVESQVEVERRPDRVPQPLDSYLAFARSLPAQFHDHTWVVNDAAGTPVATAACWSNDAGDARVMECDLHVLRSHRRLGIGSRLLALIREVTEAEGRSVLWWSTFDAVPAGEAFSRHLGGRAGRVNRTSELRMAEVDWSMVHRWIEEGPRRAPGYRLEMIDGSLPPELHADAASFHHIMQTMPRDDLDVGDVMLRVEDIAELDHARAEAGRDRWTVFVRDPSGACVGGTEVDFEPWEPTTVLQQNTGIEPAHRGLGLAKWAKAAVIERLRDEHPEVQRVRTGNAFSNAPMLAINDALGFRVISAQTEWQANLRELQLD